MSISRCQSASESSATPPRMVTPALFTSTSILPYAVSDSSTSRATSCSLVMSAFTASAVPPFATIDAETAAAPAASRSAQTTAAPSSAKRSAVSRPMPDAAPVTTAFLPASLTGAGR